MSTIGERITWKPKDVTLVLPTRAAISDQCIRCDHYLGGLACEAFPERIPQEIIIGEHDHRKPYTGDNGIRFKPAELSTNGSMHGFHVS